MKLKLLKPHTHAGVDYQVGDAVEIEDEACAEWLIEIGVADPAEPEAE
jgi:hypothetical protein